MERLPELVDKVTEEKGESREEEGREEEDEPITPPALTAEEGSTSVLGKDDDAEQDIKGNNKDNNNIIITNTNTITNHDASRVRPSTSIATQVPLPEGLELPRSAQSLELIQALARPQEPVTESACSSVVRL